MDIVESEPITNGTNHDVEEEKRTNSEEEKILRPRKPREDEVVVNGGDHKESPNIKGHKVNGCDDLDVKAAQSSKEEEIDSKILSNKQIQRGTPQLETQTKRELRQRESTPKTEEKITKEVTPERDNSHKRELRQRGSTPKTETKIIKDVTPEKETLQKRVLRQRERTPNTEAQNKRVDTPIKSVTKTVEKKIWINDLTESEDKCEASSSSPSNISFDLSNNDFKSRKPINSFSKFPGRTVSVTSVDKSMKRKAEDYVSEEENIKKFAGYIEDDQTKSAGWFQRYLGSPSATCTTSTPSLRRLPEDSLAVNYDENTILDKENFDLSESEPKKKRCIVM